MAKTSLIIKNERKKKTRPVQYRNRCRKCGRPRGYIRKFALCRLCFRQDAQDGHLPGVTLASW